MEDMVCVQTPLLDEGYWTGREEEDGVFAVFDGHQGGWFVRWVWWIAVGGSS